MAAKMASHKSDSFWLYQAWLIHEKNILSVLIPHFIEVALSDIAPRSAPAPQSLFKMSFSFQRVQKCDKTGKKSTKKDKSKRFKKGTTKVGKKITKKVQRMFNLVVQF